MADELDDLLAARAATEDDDLDTQLAARSNAVISTPKAEAPEKGSEGWWKQGLAQGFGDTFHGPAQLMQNILPDAAMNVARKAGASIVGAIPGVSKETVEDVARPRSTEEMNQLVNERESDYEARRKAAGREGMDWWRVGGALTNPVTWMTPSSEGAGVINAIKAGSKSGAFQSLLQPVASEGNFLWDKAMQTGFGAAVGGTLSGAMQALAPAFRYTTRTMRKLLGTGADDAAINQAADQQVNEVLKTAGVNPNAMDPRAYSAIQREVADAMKAGVDPNPEVMTRVADAAALDPPVNLTRAQALRDDMLYAWEHRVSGQRGVGEPLAAQMRANNQALISNLDDAGAARAMEPFEASKQVIDRIRSIDDQLRAKIGEAYGQVRDSAGRAARVDNEAFASASKNLLTEGKPELASLASLADYLPPTIAKQYDDIITGRLPLTVDTIQFLDRAWGGVQRGSGDDTAKLAIGKLRTALNDAPVSDSLGEASMAAYKAARQMARERFALIESNPAYKAIVNETKQAQPDRFFQNFVERGDVSNIKALRELIGPDQTRMLQDTMVGQLKDAALSKSDQGLFRQQAYNNVLNDAVRAPRIRELFADAPKTLDRLYRVGRAAENISKPPPVARVNYSNTAGEAANIVRDVARSEVGQAAQSMLPNFLQGVIRLGADVGEKIKEPKLVSESLRPAVSETAVSTVAKKTPPSLRRLSDLAARAGAVSAATDKREEERE